MANGLATKRPLKTYPPNNGHGPTLRGNDEKHATQGANERGAFTHECSHGKRLGSKSHPPDLLMVGVAVTAHTGD